MSNAIYYEANNKNHCVNTCGVNTPAIEIKMFWHQNDDQVCKLWGMKITYRSCRLPLAISSFQRSTRVIDHNCKPLL